MGIKLQPFHKDILKKYRSALEEDNSYIENLQIKMRNAYTNQEQLLITCTPLYLGDTELETGAVIRTFDISGIVVVYGVLSNGQELENYSPETKHIEEFNEVLVVQVHKLPNIEGESFSDIPLLVFEAERVNTLLAFNCVVVLERWVNKRQFLLLEPQPLKDTMSVILTSINKPRGEELEECDIISSLTRYDTVDNEQSFVDTITQRMYPKVNNIKGVEQSDLAEFKVYVAKHLIDTLPYLTRPITNETGVYILMSEYNHVLENVIEEFYKTYHNATSIRTVSFFS